MSGQPSVGLDLQIACVRREIALRARVYPKWIETRGLKSETAEREIRSMKAVLDTLLTLRVLVEGGAR